MSSTEIYRLGRKPGEIGETHNSWRGGMYVWEDIAKRYFNTRFPMWGVDPDLESRIWNAPRYVKVAEHDAIVLWTTMDNAVVSGKYKTQLVSAFRKYGRDHPNSSFSEQAEIIEAAEIKPGDYVAWLQTTVSEFWGRRENEKTGRWRWYNPKTAGDHFDAYESALKYTSPRRPTRQGPRPDRRG